MGGKKGRLEIINKNLESDFLDRLWEEGSGADPLENVAKMIVNHITKFEKEMADRSEKHESDLKELKKELNGLKNKLKRNKTRVRYL
ncbi:hypothetical protein HYZ82_03130 [Candidatus Nomurabacteria bacterium]|nr:hypothetical protein [Candidatus Nomurabacteria bacterium]